MKLGWAVRWVGDGVPGVYQAGDLAGLRHVGLSTGCLKKLRGSGRVLPGYVPPPEASVRVESEVPGLS